MKAAQSVSFSNYTHTRKAMSWHFDNCFSNKRIYKVNLKRTGRCMSLTATIKLIKNQLACIAVLRNLVSNTFCQSRDGPPSLTQRYSVLNVYLKVQRDFRPRFHSPADFNEIFRTLFSRKSLNIFHKSYSICSIYTHVAIQLQQLITMWSKVSVK